jgi:hypothetical protein
MTDPPPHGEGPWLEVTCSPDFVAWLARQRFALAFTTDQAGKLFLLGHHPDGARGARPS